ncbi:unnamed protein product [Mytilus edulis]|uniref:Oligopeptide/dipeptide ABC transporter C-terminal domain-containing protein n=1 Tax=Mytilus edulis TaxID=6550 RepID=A0A8S3RY22_MYTED|nr:unnamed protein product [Mytilus edulis]
MSNLRRALLKREAKHAYTKALIENIPAMSNLQCPTRPPPEGRLYRKTCIHKGLNRKHSCNVQSATRPPKEEAKHAYAKALTENIPAMSNLRCPPKEGGKTCIHKGLNRKHSCNVQSATRPLRHEKKEAKHAYTKALTENIPAMSNLRRALLKREAKHAYTKALIENIPAMSNLKTFPPREGG